MNFCCSEMVAASVTRLGHATPEKALMSGGPGPMVSGEAGGPTHWFPGHRDPATSPQKRSGKPRLHFNTCTTPQGAAPLALPSRTYFSSSELLLVLTKFPFTESVHQRTPLFFFFLTHTFLKITYFPGILPIVHISHVHLIYFFVLF